jgi:spore coat polysaccharide biosynthesis protein SpsF (cytidylyltransferase family)
MSSLALVQARMSSTRLPGKSLADVGGEPLVALVVRRLERSRHVGEVVVATSDDEVDDALVAGLAPLGIGVHRGPRDDVLTRLFDAAAGHPGPLVRITADCPFIDPEVVDRVVDLFDATSGCAYAHNIEPRTFPDGLDVEVISADALREVAQSATAARDREHVTPLIRREPGRFPAAALTNGEDLGDVRWTVDYAEDLEFVRAVVRRLADRRHEAGMEEILAAVRREPSLVGMHAEHGRRG